MGRTGTPPGAPTEYAGLGTASVPASPEEYSEYVRAVVSRYAARNPGVVTAYQPWNEANIPNYWRGTPTQMADLTKRVYDIVQSADPAATVVAASTGTRWLAGYRAFFPEYLAALKALRWPVEAFSAHMYPLAEGRNAARAALIGMVQQSLRTAGAPALPLWDTELNFGLNGAASVHLSATESSAVVARSFLDSVRFGVARVYWYAWTPPNALLGIDTWAGTPASQAFGRTYEWVVGKVFRGCAVTSVVVACTFTVRSARSTVVWAEAGSGRVRVPAGASRVQSLDGATRPARSGQTLVVGSSPALIS